MTYSNTNQSMTQSYRNKSKRLLSVLAISSLLTLSGCATLCLEQDNVALNVDSGLQQAIFATPDDASFALAQAVSKDDVVQLKKILGPDIDQLINLNELDAEEVESFVAAWEKKHQLLAQGQDKVLVAVGEAEEPWTLPIPLVKTASGWHFDAVEGKERIRIRRIGKNELATMQAVLAYYDAQMEYAEEDRNGNGILEYAQKFLSTTGTHDGLSWDTAANEKPSPLGILYADRSPDGGYHGYYYRILTAQGASAKGGAYSYLMGDNMHYGFALIAWPKKYGETGVMSFMVNHQGIVYEKNLGAEGDKLATEMQVYNPDDSWVATQEVSLSQESLSAVK